MSELKHIEEDIMGLKGQEKDNGSMAQEKNGYKGIAMVWDILLKVNLAILPPIVILGITWGQWATRSLMYLLHQDSLGPRYTPKDAELTRSIVMSDTRQLVDQQTNLIKDILNATAKDIRLSIESHAKLGGHPVMDRRMVEAEEDIDDLKREIRSTGSPIP